MPQIRPITDLRNTNEISALCHARREPVFITKNGYGDLVIMGIETYDDLVENTQTKAQPITVTDMSGDNVTISRKVRRILCLWPSIAASLFALGAGGLVQGVGDNTTRAISDWTEFFYLGAHTIPCNGIMPTMEEIFKIAPDLVIVHPWTLSSGYAQHIRDAGIPAINLYFSDYQTMISAYTVLGKILGGEYQEKLNQWCCAMWKKIDHIRTITDAIPEEKRPIVYYIPGQQKCLLPKADVNSILKYWTEFAGGRFAAALMNTGEQERDHIDEEELFALNPNIILVGGPFQHTLIDQITSDNRWKDLDATKNGRVYHIPYGCFNWDRFGLESLLQLDYALMCIQPEIAAKNGINRGTVIQETIGFYQYYNGVTLTETQAENMLNGLLPDGTVELPPVPVCEYQKTASGTGIL